MKAIGYPGRPSLDTLGTIDVSSPEYLRADEVRIESLAWGLNHVDLWLPTMDVLSSRIKEFPHVAGADVCGIVRESTSSKFNAGDRVVVYPGYNTGTDPQTELAENRRSDYRIRGENGYGVFSQEVIVADQYVIHAPEHLGNVQAAVMPLVYCTAYQMIELAFESLDAPDTAGPVLVHGAGSGVTHALLELLLATGLTHIVVTSRSEAKLAHWRERGVEGIVGGEELSTQLNAYIREHGRFSAVFDHVGRAYAQVNVRFLADNGHLVMCGCTSGSDVTIDARHLFIRHLTVHGSTMGSLEAFRRVMAFVERKEIRPIVSGVFDSEKAGDAWDMLAHSKQDGKIAIIPSW